MKAVHGLLTISKIMCLTNTLRASTITDMELSFSFTTTTLWHWLIYIRNYVKVMWLPGSFIMRHSAHPSPNWRLLVVGSEQGFCPLIHLLRSNLAMFCLLWRQWPSHTLQASFFRFSQWKFSSVVRHIVQLLLLPTFWLPTDTDSVIACEHENDTCRQQWRMAAVP